MSIGTNKERLEQNNNKLTEIKDKVERLPDSVNTENANAMPEDILEDKLAYGRGQEIRGTMKNLGNVSVEPSINDVNTIAQNGYVSNVVVPSIKTSIDENSKYAITGNYSSAGPNATSVSGSVNTTIGNGVLAFIMTREEIDLTPDGWTHIGHNNLVTTEGWLQYLYVYGKIATEETTTLTLSGGNMRRAITLIALDTPNLPECVYNQAFNSMTTVYRIGDVKTDDIVTSTQFWALTSGPWYGMNLTGASATKYFNAASEDRLNVFKINSSQDLVYINTGSGTDSQITVMILRYPEALNSAYIKANTKILDVVGTFTSDADATASDIAEGKIAYVNGEKIIGTGTMTTEDLQEQLDNQDLAIQHLQDELYNKIRSKYNMRIDMNVSSPNMQLIKFIVEIADGFIDVSNFISTANMFDYFINLQSVPLFDTSKIENMSYMFNYCKSLKTVPLFNTSKVKNMSYMFDHCVSLETIPLLDTSAAMNMKNMFNHCETITSLPILDTSSLQNAEALFGGCYLLENLPEIDLSSATITKGMCWDCTTITSIPAYDISKSTNTQNMFRNCTNLVDIPIFNLANVTNMQQMFLDCLNLSNDSLNNILAMCISAVKMTSNKTLQYLGLTSDQATVCTTLSNYDAFIEAGWRTGY